MSALLLHEYDNKKNYRILKHLPSPDHMQIHMQILKSILWFDTFLMSSCQESDQTATNSSEHP